MLCRFLALAGLLLVGGCAYDAGYYESGYASQPNSAAGYYPADYGTPYLPSSPVYGAPYVNGPVAGGIYSYGDSYDTYGGPVFSPYHGIRCDRRRNVCWSQYGPDPHWTTRFFGHRQAHWNGGNWQDGNWNHGHGNHGGWNNGGGDGHWPNHGGNHGGPNPGGNNDRPWVHRVPKDPDGRGTPTFLPNACGGNGQPPC
jgi:hypothetical protein